MYSLDTVLSSLFDCAGSSLLSGGRLSLVLTSRGYALLTVCGLLTAVAPPAAEHRL